jgi:peptidoglycan/LPS O-acetylase OafA/YrhL
LFNRGSDFFRQSPTPWLFGFVIERLLRHQLLRTFFYGPAARAIIVSAMSLERAKSVLETTPILWLGTISYSLYLLHVPILLLAIHLLYGHIPILAIVTFVVVVAPGASDIAYRCIEAPVITLGANC